MRPGSQDLGLAQGRGKMGGGRAPGSTSSPAPVEVADGADRTPRAAPAALLDIRHCCKTET